MVTRLFILQQRGERRSGLHGFGEPEQGPTILSTAVAHETSGRIFIDLHFKLLSVIQAFLLSQVGLREFLEEAGDIEERMNFWVWKHRASLLVIQDYFTSLAIADEPSQRMVSFFVFCIMSGRGKLVVFPFNFSFISFSRP